MIPKTGSSLPHLQDHAIEENSTPSGSAKIADELAGRVGRVALGAVNADKEEASIPYKRGRSTLGSGEENMSPKKHPQKYPLLEQAGMPNRYIEDASPERVQWLSRESDLVKKWIANGVAPEMLSHELSDSQLRGWIRLAAEGFKITKDSAPLAQCIVCHRPSQWQKLKTLFSDLRAIQTLTLPQITYLFDHLNSVASFQEKARLVDYKCNLGGLSIADAAKNARYFFDSFYACAQSAELLFQHPHYELIGESGEALFTLWYANHTSSDFRATEWNDELLKVCCEQPEAASRLLQLFARDKINHPMNTFTAHGLREFLSAIDELEVAYWPAVVSRYDMLQTLPKGVLKKIAPYLFMLIYAWQQQMPTEKKKSPHFQLDRLLIAFSELPVRRRESFFSYRPTNEEIVGWYFAPRNNDFFRVTADETDWKHCLQQMSPHKPPAELVHSINSSPKTMR